MKVITLLNKALRIIGIHSKKDITHKIGSVEVKLPFDHKLPFYQDKYKMYDFKLGEIAKKVFEKYPNSICIDIGANVGDSAAVIRSKSSVPIVCIEGDERFYEYLYKNTKNIKEVKIIKAFVGDMDGDIPRKIHRVNGTGRFLKNDYNSTKIRKLTTVLNEEGIDCDRLKMLKIDTDGFDFDIILGNFDAIKTSKCNLFFEYEIDGTSIEKSLNVVNSMKNEGYQFIVYDNYGQMMAYISENESIERFNELNHYILTSNKFGGGIRYADIFASLDQDILDALLSIEKELIKS